MTARRIAQARPWIAQARPWLAQALMALGLALGPSPALAHKSSDAYLTLNHQAQGPARATLRVDIALRDLDRDLDLDANQNQALEWREVRERWADLDALVQAHLQWRADDQACRLDGGQGGASTPQLDRHSDGAYAVLTYVVVCPSAGPLQWQYTLFASSDADHRGLLRQVAIAAPTGSPTAEPSTSVQVMVPSARWMPLASPLEPGTQGGATAVSVAASHPFWGMVTEGARHIAIGVDHVLFLVTLLLVTVMHRGEAQWLPQRQTRPIVTEVLKVVTAFTVSHSITLSVAALGLVSVSSRWVETLIALSVVVAALDNVFGWLRSPRWAMAGAFGLVHGFGFAGPLQDMGLHGSALALPLFGFNLGVELGQLALVALVLPVLMALRHQRAYRRWVLPGLSLAIALMGVVWAFQRGLHPNL